MIQIEKMNPNVNNAEKGTAYGVGVGPGDPELMTLAAVRLINENKVIAVPGRSAEDSAAFRIAKAAVPDIAGKELVPLNMPMTKDRRKMAEYHRKAAALIEKYLDKGENVVFLTLGDAGIYSTFSYLQDILEADGYKTGLVCGVPSFCAAAAKLGGPLVKWDEPLHIIPALHQTEDCFDQKGTVVLMKTGSCLKTVKEQLDRSRKTAQMAVDCGMETEVLYRDARTFPDEAGYFSLIIARDHEAP